MSSAATAHRRAGRGVGSDDDVRTARLIFDRELASGAVSPDMVCGRATLAANPVRPFPAAPVRLAQDCGRKLGRGHYDRVVAEPLLKMRRILLGPLAAAPPRFLVRVDEFPHYRAWDEPERYGTRAFERFHQILSEANLPYLAAVLPRVSRQPLSPKTLGSRPLDDEEAAMLGRLVAAGVAIGLHGRDHRTRYAAPRRHSELGGRSPAATRELLDTAELELAGLGVQTDVFVPPFNRLDPGQFEQIARRFTIICGGPESVRRLGFQRPPQWRDGAVYLPAYAPFYGRAADILPAARRMIDRQAALWIPIVIHWGWEADGGWRDLEELASCIAPYTERWESFRAAVGRSRGGAS